MPGLSVLIPTSGCGSRLGELTEHTNKALVRVGTKAVLSHIVDSYPLGTRFYIMLGHKGELVREYVTLVYPGLDVVYLDEELTTGENLGLVGAIRAQRDLIEPGPLVFHASDTILTLPPYFLAAEESIVLGYPATGDVSMYRMDRARGTLVSRIMEKGEQTGPDDLVHIGVVRFQDSQEFCRVLDALEDFDCDTHIVNALIADGGDAFRLLTSPDWYDTGNMSKLAEARKHFEDPELVLLEKVDQAVYILGDRVVKFFADPKMVSSRVRRARKIGSAIPVILGSTEHFFAYRKAEGSMARDTLYPSGMKAFLRWAAEKLWQPRQVSRELLRDQARLFYFFKTAARVCKFYEKSGVADLADTVNGRELPTLDELLKQIDWEGLCNIEPCSGMHGDLHFSNILMCPDGDYALIDWREDFGGNPDCGDVYYDLGKLLHGMIVSHDMVEKGLFTINIEETGNSRSVTFDIMRHHRHVECEQSFEQWVRSRGLSWDRVRLVCALIYLNIAPLHHHPYDKFLYFLGKDMIYDLTYDKAANL